MKNPVRKIILLILVIAVLPVLLFTYKEISNLNENEKVLEDIYKNQLESILFSVNQYSEDMARSWINKLETGRIINARPGETDRAAADKFFNSISVVNYVVISDSSLDNQTEYKRDENLSSVLNSVELFDPSASKLKPVIERLYRYKRNNFQKIEPVESGVKSPVQFVLFVLNNGRICFLGFNKNDFVSGLLVNKIQSVSRGEFSIIVTNTNDGDVVYSTDTTVTRTRGQNRGLWIIPDYSLSAALRGETVESLVRERSMTNIYFIVGLSILMLLFGWFALKNIRKEIELARIKSDFVSNVSHELRTPLALINMFAETLAMGRVKSEEKKNEYYNIIRQETERLSKIVNKILSFSKMEAGKWKYSFADMDLNELAGSIYGNYKFHTENLGFAFLYEEFENPLKIYADAEAVSEAVINLIDNAVKYSSTVKKIILRTGLEGKFAYVEVKDSGVGISHEDQKKIFDKFFRVSHGDLHNTKGTGLGLTLVKHIVNAHNGEIRLESEPGDGAAFRLMFPVAENIKESV